MYVRTHVYMYVPRQQMARRAATQAEALWRWASRGKQQSLMVLQSTMSARFRGRDDAQFAPSGMVEGHRHGDLLFASKTFYWQLWN
jgi:hypothetical protein